MSLFMHLAIDSIEYYSNLDYDDRVRINLATTGMVPFQQYPKWTPSDIHPWNKRGYHYTTLPQHTRPGLAVIASRAAVPVAITAGSYAVATQYVAPMMGEELHQSMQSTGAIPGRPQTQPAWLAVPKFIVGFFI